MVKFLREFIRFLVYLSLLTPLIVNQNFFFLFVSPKSLYFFVISEIIFFSWLILINYSFTFRPKLNLILISLSFYLLILFLSSIFGIDFSNSFWSKHERMTGLLMHLHLFGFFLALSSTFNKEDFEKFFAFSIFVAILIGIDAILNVEIPAFRGGGRLGNESFLGTYLLFNLFFSLYLSFSSKNYLKIFGVVSFFILSFCLLATGVSFEGKDFSSYLFSFLFKEGARAAKISFYGGLVFLFLLYLSFSRIKFLKIFGILSLTLSTSLVVFAIYSVLFQEKSFFREIFEKEVGSFGGRFFVWEIAKKGFFERPILGWGPENFEFVFLKYFNPCFGTQVCGSDVWYDKAHNIIFDTLVQSGIFGLISYFSIFFASFYILWKNVLNKKADFWAGGVFSSLFVSYFVQNLTVFDMVSSFLVFFLSLSFLASLENEKEKIQIKNPNQIFIIFSLFSLFLSLLFFGLLPMISSTSVIKAITLPVSTKERLEFTKRAIFISPLGRIQIRKYLTEKSIEELKDMPKFSSRERELLEFLGNELKKNIQKGFDFDSYLKLGQVLKLSSIFAPEKKIEAEKILQEAVEKFPTNQRGYWELAGAKLLLGKFDEAINLAQKALDLEKDLFQAHQILIRVLILSGKKDLAKEKMEQAVKNHPEWEDELKKIFD